MARKSYVFYESFWEAMKGLEAEDVKECLKAISEYALYDIEPETDGISKTVFALVKPQIDANNKRYENGKKGGRPKAKDNQTETKTKPNHNQNETKVKPNVNVNVNVNDNVNVIRHKYGVYKNVLLSDKDMDKLKEEFPKDFKERIERLSEYMASTGKSYKNHLATIRSWARKNADSKPQEIKPKKYKEFETEEWQRPDFKKEQMPDNMRQMFSSIGKKV